MDLVIMPSRTEGFGLTALEALSAGLPVLAGHNSGFSEALRKVEFVELCVVKSDEPEDWSKAIKMVRQKERKKRLKEMQRLRESYGKIYNWEEQCEILVREMRRKLFGKQVLFFSFPSLLYSNLWQLKQWIFFESAFYFFSLLLSIYSFFSSFVYRYIDLSFIYKLIYVFTYS